MNQDLDAVLRDLADGAAAAHRAHRETGAGVSTSDVTRRVRRHRRVRAGLTTGAALVVVGALALGGAALAQRPDPQPAGTPTPTTAPAPSSPSPTATSDADDASVVLPSGDASLAYGSCGSLTSTAVPGGADTTVQLDLSVRATEVSAGEPLVVDAVRSRDEDPEAVLVLEDAGARATVSRDGVVVATTTFGSTDLDVDLAIDGMSWRTYVTDRLPLVTCTPDGDPDVVAGLPLPAGTYQVQLWTPVRDLGDDASVVTGADGGTLPVADIPDDLGSTATAVSTTVTVTVTGQATVAQAEPNLDATVTEPDAGTWLGCGDPAPVAGSTSSFRLTSSAGTSSVPLADLASVTTDLQYEGPGRAEMYLDGVFAFVFQDGQLVGTDFVPLESTSRMLLGSALTVTQSLADPASVLACAADGSTTADPLPSGEYQVYPAAFLAPVSYLLPDGGSVATTVDNTVVYAEPFTLVVP